MNDAVFIALHPRCIHGQVANFCRVCAEQGTDLRNLLAAGQSYGPLMLALKLERYNKWWRRLRRGLSGKGFNRRVYICVAQNCENVAGISSSDPFCPEHNWDNWW